MFSPFCTLWTDENTLYCSATYCENNFIGNTFFVSMRRLFGSHGNVPSQSGEGSFVVVATAMGRNIVTLALTKEDIAERCILFFQFG